MPQLSDASSSLSDWNAPAILLVDLDAFFASVEQLDHPDWRGKPVIVGGDADAHGVVSTCSYEARAFGVRSAMPSSRAAKLCPHAIWTHGDHGRYREMSNIIMDIIRDETPLVEQVSIDEAFADVTPTRANREHPVEVAARIQRRVEELGVTCSIGIGTTKAIAKIASDMDKPRGLTIVYPGGEEAFLAELPVRILSGVGARAEEALGRYGITTLGQMARADDRILASVFGKNAEEMRARASGCDASGINTAHETKSVSHEMTFARDLRTQDEIFAALSTLLAKVGRRLRRKGLAGTTLTIKVRFDDRTLHTAQRRLSDRTDDDLALIPLARELVMRVWRPGIKIRLLGVAMSGFEEDEKVQDSLFDEGAFSEEADASDLLIEDEQKRRELLSATDALKERFGEDAVVFGSELKAAGNTTGTASKHPADYK